MNIKLCIKHLQRVTMVQGSWKTQSYQENRSVWRQFVTFSPSVLSVCSQVQHLFILMPFCVYPFYSTVSTGSWIFSVICSVGDHPQCWQNCCYCLPTVLLWTFVLFPSHLHVLFSHFLTTLSGNDNSEKSSKILPLCRTVWAFLLTGVAQSRGSPTSGRCWQHRASK